MTPLLFASVYTIVGIILVVGIIILSGELRVSDLIYMWSAIALWPLLIISILAYAINYNLKSRVLWRRNADK